MAQRRLPFSGFLPETGAADNNGEKKLGILLPVTVPVRLPTLTSFIIPHMLDAIGFIFYIHLVRHLRTSLSAGCSHVSCLG
jgi:hypothetical protein